MDLLKNSAEHFNKYVGYNYTFVLDCDMSVEVMFKSSHFHHLVGLQYLKDIVQVVRDNKKNSAKNIFKRILKGKIPHEVIASSSYYSKIEERLTYFSNIDNVISSKLIIDFDYTRVPNTGLLSTYLLYQQYDDNTYLILGLRYDIKNDIYIPETFIVEHSDYYIKNQISYDIIEVKKEKFVKPKK